MWPKMLLGTTRKIIAFAGVGMAGISLSLSALARAQTSTALERSKWIQVMADRSAEAVETCGRRHGWRVEIVDKDRFIRAYHYLADGKFPLERVPEAIIRATIVQFDEDVAKCVVCPGSVCPQWK